MQQRQRPKPGVSDVRQTQVVPVKREVINVMFGEEQVEYRVLKLFLCTVGISLTEKLFRKLKEQCKAAELMRKIVVEIGLKIY